MMNRGHFRTLLIASGLAHQNAQAKSAWRLATGYRSESFHTERVSRDFSVEIKRLGERFSLEWIRKVGREANDLFIPYFMQQ